MNGSRSAWFSPSASELTYLSVFLWKPSNYVKHIMTSEKERSPSRFARKNMQLTQRGPNDSRSARELTSLSVFPWEPCMYIKHIKASKKKRSLRHFVRKSMDYPKRLQIGPVCPVCTQTHVFECFPTETMQLHQTRHNKCKGALCGPLRSKDHEIIPNGSRTARFAPSTHILTVCVFSYRNHAITANTG